MDNKNPSAPGAYAPNFPPPNTNAQGYAQPPYGFDSTYAPTGPPMPNNAPQGYQPMPQAPYPIPGQQPPYSIPGHQSPYNVPGQQPPGYGMPPGGPVIMNQPHPGHQPIDNGNGWMNVPLGIPNCPPGLEYLTTIDQLLVKQKVELLEAFTGFETNNKFTIKNSLGQKVYWAVEDTDCCTRNCCGPARPFDMKIMDIYQNEVIHLYRPLACSSCCFPCCLQSMEVSAPPGNRIGSIEQEWSICYPSFAIKNQSGDTVLRIEGPLCTFTMCGDVEFKIVTMNGDEVGKISKQWSGLMREMFTDADFFGINFPMDLDVRMKAVMLGACFLIDAMFFEKAQNRENDRPGMF